MPQIRYAMQADWTELVALNFHVDPNVFKNILPAGLELDYFNDETFISLIAVQLRNVKIWGLSLPIARRFPHIALRYHVRRLVDGQYRRGFCTIKSFVPSRFAAFVLQTVFKTEFARTAISSETSGFASANAEEVPTAEYRWTHDSHVNKIRIKARHRLRAIEPDSKMHFILNKEYRYVSSKGRTLEYHVQATPWSLWDAAQATFQCDSNNLFGSAFAKYLAKRPVSVFIGEKSSVGIERPQIIG